MIEVLKILAQQLNSAVFVLLLLLVLAFILTSKISGWIVYLKTDRKRLDKFEKKTEDSMNTLVELKTKVNLIYQIVNPNIPIKATSPLSLTTVGEKMKEQMNADIIFNRIVGSEKANILKSHQEKNAYDIQMACIEWAKHNVPSLLTTEELSSIKKIAFDNGILLEDVLEILGMMMRDNILQELSMSIVDVDLHTPDN